MTYKTVPEALASLGAIYKERNAIYKDNYKHFGKIMLGCFPNGLTLTTEEDFNRFALFVQLAAKVSRYGNTFLDGGHADSLDDASVYSQMLREFDNECREANRDPKVESYKTAPLVNPPLRTDGYASDLDRRAHEAYHEKTLQDPSTNTTFMAEKERLQSQDERDAARRQEMLRG